MRVLALLVAGVASASAAYTVGLHELRAKTSGTDPHDQDAQSSAFYTMNIAVGSQNFDVRIDTYSNMLVLPSTLDGLPAQSTSKDDAKYNPMLDTGAKMVGCHSMECVSIPDISTASSSAPTICQKKVKDNGVVCPAAGDSGHGLSKATCKPNPAATGANAQTSCEDHLNPSCTLVTQTYNYSCSTDMGVFNPSLKGQLLSSYCPQTCNVPCGTVRYCRDNDQWSDPATGYTCSNYASDTILQTQCFNSPAYIACPVACGACGDCCSASDGCFFYEFYRDGGKVEGTKYKSTIQIRQAQDSATQTVGAVSPVVTNAIIGAVVSNSSFWEPNREIDGVWGLGNTQACNPACSNATMLSMTAGVGGPKLSDVLGFCLRQAPAVSSLDIGGVVPQHTAGGLASDVKFIALEESTYYMMPAPTKVTVEGGVAGGTQTLPASKTRNNVVFDITTPWIFFPKQAFELLKTALFSAASTGICADAACSPTTMIPTADIFSSSCAAVGNDIAWQQNLPTLKFYFVTNTSETVSVDFGPETYLKQLKFIVPNTTTPTSPPVQLSRLCSAVKAVETDDFVFGQVAVTSKYWVVSETPDTTFLGFADQGACEYNVAGNPAACRVEEKQCKDGTCVPASSYNDGTFDCLDGSDEPNGVTRDERCKAVPVVGATSQNPAPSGANKWRTDNGLIEVVNAMSPAGTKIAILYCETGFTPTAARTAFCNDNKNATGFAATGGWETQFGSKPCKALAADNSDCKETAGAGGITCGQLLKATGKCATGRNCEQTSCDWAKTTYSLDCRCNCVAGVVDACTTLQTVMNTACGTANPATDTTCTPMTTPTCSNCNSTQNGLTDGSCVAATSGAVNMIPCQPCSTCAHPCTIALVDHFEEMQSCNAKNASTVVLPPAWAPYTNSIQKLCGRSSAH